jgi:hypothetical protein
MAAREAVTHVAASRRRVRTCAGRANAVSPDDAQLRVGMHDPRASAGIDMHDITFMERFPSPTPAFGGDVPARE